MNLRSPIDPAKFPFYYGWVILSVGTLGIVMSIPGQTMGVNVFVDSLIESLGVKRTYLSLAYLLGTLTSSFSLAFVGRLLERWGTRRMVIVATTGLSASLGLLAVAPWIAALLPGDLPRFWAGFVLAYLAFFGVRHFGQGQMTIIPRTMIGRWFESRRGLAFAISGAFVSLGFGSAPFVLDQLISTFQWQGALVVLIAAEMAMLIIGMLFYRDSVESCQMEMEQGMPPRRGVTRFAAASNSLTADEAKRTAVFWLFCLGLALFAANITGVVFHFAAICEPKGIAREQAFTLFLPITVVGVTTEIVGSYLSDHISVRYHFLVMQAAMCVGMIAVVFVGTTPGAILMVAGIGVTNGMFATLSGVAWPKLFGRAHLGAINGVISGWLVFGSAFSPFVYSLGQEIFGNFDLVLLLSAVPAGLLFGAAFFIGVPDRHREN